MFAGYHACIKQRIDHHCVGKIAAFDVVHVLMLGPYTVKDGHRTVGGTVVIAPHHRHIIGIRADHSDAFVVFLQWKHVLLVLQQHDRLACHIERKLAVSLAIHYRIRDFRPWNKRRVVHFAKVETPFKQTKHMFVDLLLADQAALHSFGNTLIGVVETAFHIGSGQRGLGCGMNSIT